MGRFGTVGTTVPNHDSARLALVQDAKRRQYGASREELGRAPSLVPHPPSLRGRRLGRPALVGFIHIGREGGGAYLCALGLSWLRPSPWARGRRPVSTRSPPSPPFFSQIDTAALDEQVSARRARAEAEAEAAVREAERENAVREELSRRASAAEASRRAGALALAEARLAATASGRREDDLNHAPVPGLDADDLERLVAHPSAAQRFVGEDLGRAAREAARRDELRDGLRTQGAELRARAARAAEALDAARAEAAACQAELERRAADADAARSAGRAAVRGENLALAAAARERAAAAAAEAARLAAVEAAAVAASPWLNEAADARVNPDGTTRRDAFKGFGAAAEAAAAAEVAAQCADLAARREADAAAEMRAARDARRAAAAAEAAELAHRARRAASRADLAAALLDQAAAGRANAATLAETYRPAVGAGYFDQFGTSHR